MLDRNQENVPAMLEPNSDEAQNNEDVYRATPVDEEYTPGTDYLSIRKESDDSAS